MVTRTLHHLVNRAERASITSLELMEIELATTGVRIVAGVNYLLHIGDHQVREEEKSDSRSTRPTSRWSAARHLYTSHDAGDAISRRLVLCERWPRMAGTLLPHAPFAQIAAARVSDSRWITRTSSINTLR